MPQIQTPPAMFWNLLTFGAASWLVGKRMERKALESMQRHEEELEQELEQALEEARWEAELDAEDDFDLEDIEELDEDDLDDFDEDAEDEY